jgi:hypothetical protein
VNVIARIERACARVVEDTFARVFPSALDPAQIGRRLVAMAQASDGDLYLVRVHPTDYARLAPDRDFLEARWSAMLREAAAPTHGGAARVVIDEDAAIVAGTLAIEAVVDEHPALAARVLERSDGTRIALRDGLTLGRARENGVVLRDGRASRVHARIVAVDDAWYVEDLGSSNGTFVDGVRVERAALVADTRLTIGDTLLTVRDA